MDRIALLEDPNHHQVIKLNWSGLGVVEVEGKVRWRLLTRPLETVRVKWHDGLGAYDW